MRPNLCSAIMSLLIHFPSSLPLQWSYPTLAVPPTPHVASWQSCPPTTCWQAYRAQTCPANSNSSAALRLFNSASVLLRIILVTQSVVITRKVRAVSDQEINLWWSIAVVLTCSRNMKVNLCLSLLDLTMFKEITHLWYLTWILKEEVYTIDILRTCLGTLWQRS